MNHAWNDNKRPWYISGGSSLLSFPKWPFKCFILKWSQLCKKVRLEDCLRRFENLNMDEFHEYIWCTVHSCVLSSIQVIESSLHIENQCNVNFHLYAAIKRSINNETPFFCHHDFNAPKCELIRNAYFANRFLLQI